MMKIMLLGRFRCELDGAGVVNLEARKAQELLSYLALFSQRMHHRDVLAGVLWQDRSDEQAKKGLRQALWLLQCALDNHSPGAGKHYLITDSEWIGFSPGADIWIDAAELEHVYDQYRSDSSTCLEPSHVQQIRQATELYGGDLLEGWYCEWCIHCRERLQFMYLALLDKLLAHCEMVGDYAGGVHLGMQLLKHDRARESTHRRLMCLHYLAGQRTLALQQYAACVAALREELSVQPAKSTQNLYAQICSDELDCMNVATRVLPEKDAPTSLVLTDDPRQQLMAISQMLIALQQQVDLLIAAYR